MLMIHQENIAYYDKIAGEYDALLGKVQSDSLIRQRVKEKFIKTVEPGCVLDFGGGTGLDSEWLIANGYTVIFCEPSVGMREKAFRLNGHNINSSKMTFLSGSATDFTTWHKEFPFTEKADAALANFGVINNIADLNQLFKNMALVMKPGAHFFMLFLARNFKSMFKWNAGNALKSLLFRSPFIMYTWHEQHRQTVFVHSVEDIKKASTPFFNYTNCTYLGGFGFNLVHLIRK